MLSLCVFVLAFLATAQADHLVAVQPVGALSSTQINHLKQHTDFRGIFPSFGLVAVGELDTVHSFSGLTGRFPSLQFTSIETSFSPESRCFVFDTLLHTMNSSDVRDLVICSRLGSPVDLDTDEWIPVPFRSLSGVPASLDESPLGSTRMSYSPKKISS